MLRNHSMESDLYYKACRNEIVARIKFRQEKYDEAIECYQSAIKMLMLYSEGQPERDDNLAKIINIYWKLGEAYEALAIQTNNLEPIEHEISALSKLLQYRPYDRNVRLKRCALWKTLENRKDAIIDALVYFCVEISKDCIDISLENISQILTDDLKHLVIEEYDQIDNYAQSLKPFLTQDFINLWLSCDCNDPLVEDIWNVRNEQLGTITNDTVPLREDQYKQALKALSNGELLSVIKILEKASKNGNYRCEATLLLALAHTRYDGAIVDKYLERFEQIWEEKPQGYNKRRCQQLIIRYISISRAIRLDPFSGKKLENTTKEMEANLYLQEALVIFWRRQNSDNGEVFWKESLKSDNVRKLQHIRKLCDLALAAKRDFPAAKILKLRSILELKMANSLSVLTDSDLKPLEDIINETNKTFPIYNSFGDLCLYSVYLSNSMTDKAKLCCQKMLETLFFRGQPMAFLIRYNWDIDRNQTLAQLNMLIANEPENYVAHILLYYYYFKHGNLNCAFTHANCALKYWPYHTNTDNLLLYIHEYVRCYLLRAVQQELNLAVEASFRIMATLSLPVFDDLQQDHAIIRRDFATEANASESEKASGTPKSYLVEAITVVKCKENSHSRREKIRHRCKNFSSKAKNISCEMEREKYIYKAFIKLLNTSRF
ncbi:SH2 domain-containing protein 4A [Dirofilaria immitis]